MDSLRVVWGKFKFCFMISCSEVESRSSCSVAYSTDLTSKYFMELKPKPRAFAGFAYVTEF